MMTAPLCTAPTGAQLQIFDDADALGEAFARELTALAARRIGETGTFSLALTGGHTPAPLYARLGQAPWRDAIDWTRVKIFFGDERTVPPGHVDSNYRMAWDAWLADGPVPHDQIFRMEGEDADPPSAAARYAALLARELPRNAAGFPCLDLVLLGMGGDGHVASLFPGTRALDERQAYAVANPVPQQLTTRLTVTFPVLDAAGAIWMLVTGAGKAAPAAQALGWAGEARAVPAGRLRAEGGRVRWWLDRAAAAALPETVMNRER